MIDFCPFYTNDGSVGLYSKTFNDIFHSADGALTESYEKFIYPSNIDNLVSQLDIKVLDICYGIGYNTKSFLNYFFEKKFFTKCTDSYDSIYTDNNFSSKDMSCSDTIYSDKIFETYNKKTLKNLKNKIFIKAIDNDKFLAGISPFIKTGCESFNNKNVCFDIVKYEKYFNNDKSRIIKLRPEVNYILLESLLLNNSEVFEDSLVNQVLNNPLLEQYFEPDLKALYQILSKQDDLFPSSYSNTLNLHNIYYRHISERYKINAKTYENIDITFELNIDDARNVIKKDTNIYNLIFLDAFTPSKCPCLWSYEFFKELYRLLDKEGILLTYSMSAAVRSAMQEAGFIIGNVFNKRLNKYTGTVAVKNYSLIKHSLSEADLGLLKTKAGIFYRDENLNAQNEAIIERRNFEVANSDKVSSSAYKHNIQNI